MDEIWQQYEALHEINVPEDYAHGVIVGMFYITAWMLDGIIHNMEIDNSVTKLKEYRWNFIMLGSCFIGNNNF